MDSKSLLEGSKLWVVEARIQLKSSLKDPEGETILRDLLHKRGVSGVEEVRTAKLLRFKVRSHSREDAESLIRKVCDELRLYNPVSHTCSVRVGEEV
ncbi:Phosphoribosylformylglycinamidine synthase subunit PurS [Candidatus Calditenuaceae archaeon HR02]|nr:Phosphoribosylformylglycinamidine synthase subunit PurS [Candidatus Calditenuaceae archaeon HR02]